MIVGYARVISDGQTRDAQEATLKAAGAERVFSEKVSGAQTNRKALAKAIAALAAGDVLLVTRLDRLARSTRDLLNVLATISEKGAGAQARGIRFGRKPKLSAFQIAEALARREAGETLTDIGRSYGVSHSTISRL